MTTSASLSADVLSYLSQVRIVDDPIDGRALIDARPERERYVRHHARAASLSLSMLRPHLGPEAQVLELGGAPYLFSALMHRHFGVRLTAVNVEAGAWPGQPARTSGGRVTLSVPDDGQKGELSIDVKILNVEKDPFPFETATFDLVLCMEILEHLGYSPSHMLAESHRVLKPGGLLFITVPNFINIKRTVNMLLNRPTEYPYSGYGIYGRHQREWAPSEVRKALEACSYQVVELRTANVWPTFTGGRLKGIGNATLNLLTALPIPWLVAKREYILCLARPVGEPVAAYPAWLYTHRRLYPDPPHGVRKVLD